MNRIFLAALLAFQLAGCSTTSSWLSSLTAGEDNSAPPRPLPDIEPSVQLNKRWSVDTGAGFGEFTLKLQPAYGDGRIYVASHDGRVLALDAVNGRQVWSVKTGTAISGGPGIGEGLVLVGTTDAEIIALDAEDGSERWRAMASSEVLSIPQTAFERVIVQAADGSITGLDATDGSQQWRYDRSVPVLTLRGTSTPAVERGLVVAGFSNGKLVALTADRGLVAWESSVAVPRGRSELERIVDIDGDPVIRGSTVFVATYQGTLAELNVRSGEAGWKRDISSHAGLDVDFSRVYVTDDKSRLWALSRTTGAAEWKLEQLENRKLTAPGLLADYIAVGDFEGYLHLVARHNGALAARVAVDGEGISARPLVADDVVYVYGNSGKLASYTLTSP